MRNISLLLTLVQVQEKASKPFIVRIVHIASAVSTAKSTSAVGPSVRVSINLGDQLKLIISPLFWPINRLISTKMKRSYFGLTADTILMNVKCQTNVHLCLNPCKCQKSKYPNEHRSEATQNFGECLQAWKSCMTSVIHLINFILEQTRRILIPVNMQSLVCKISCGHDFISSVHCSVLKAQFNRLKQICSISWSSENLN